MYPLNAWRDAPVFPTPRHALKALPAQAPLAPAARVLDAGCGLGDGLLALRAAYPQVALDGIEWSWPLRVACALRCPWARVRRADMWKTDWSGYQMVYLFQRPEAWPALPPRPRPRWPRHLAGEPGVCRARVCCPCPVRAPGGRVVWIYRLPLRGQRK